MYRCQWSGCSSAFQSREELVGHVTVTHLLEVQATAKSPTPPPAPFTQSQLSTTPSWDNHLQATQQANFDHSIKCLWDSCNVPLFDPASASNTGTPDMSSLHGQSTNTNNTMNAFAPAGTNTLPDASTATLVRHLLQDHLHLSTNIFNPTNTTMSAFQAQDNTLQHHIGLNNQNNSTFQTTRIPNTLDNSEYSRLFPHKPNAELQSSHFSGIPPTPPLSNLDSTQPFDIYHVPPLETMSAPTIDHQANHVHHVTRVNHVNQISTVDTSKAPTSTFSERASAGPATIPQPAIHRCKWQSCSLEFPTTAALMEHISADHIGSGKSMYYCHWKGCERAQEGRGFNQRQKILRHVRTHVGDRPFVCPECGRGFSESTTLAQHIRTHTNEKPFVCPEPGCGKAFAIQSALTIHMRSHSGEKPFKCPEPGCNMCFAESSNLSKHIKTHQPTNKRHHHAVHRKPEAHVHKKRRSHLHNSLTATATA